MQLQNQLCHGFLSVQGTFFVTEKSTLVSVLACTLMFRKKKVLKCPNMAPLKVEVSSASKVHGVDYSLICCFCFSHHCQCLQTWNYMLSSLKLGNVYMWKMHSVIINPVCFIGVLKCLSSPQQRSLIDFSICQVSIWVPCCEYFLWQCCDRVWHINFLFWFQDQGFHVKSDRG